MSQDETEPSSEAPETLHVVAKRHPFRKKEEPDLHESEIFIVQDEEKRFHVCRRYETSYLTLDEAVIASDSFYPEMKQNRESQLNVAQELLREILQHWISSNKKIEKTLLRAARFMRFKVPDGRFPSPARLSSSQPEVKGGKRTVRRRRTMK